MNAILQELSYTQQEQEEARSQYMQEEIQQQKLEFLQLYNNYNKILVTGQTGCGKSSYIPMFITEQHKDHKILICQPRRLSVLSQCKRLSEIGNFQVTKEIGYMMGDEHFDSPMNKIVVATSGSAFNHILLNPDLYDTIILDEIHEMNEQTQQVMSILLKIQPKYNFKLILMSATADCELINNTFQNLAHFELEGTYKQQQYHVEIEEAVQSFQYKNKVIEGPILPKELNQEILIQVGTYQVLRIMLTMNNKKGDILVFLPGIRQMESFKKQFIKLANQYKLPQQQYELMYFHAAFSQTYKKQFGNMKLEDELEEQIEQSTDQEQITISVSTQSQIGTFRRIILGTNVCETSITIPSLGFVVDTCMEKHFINGSLQTTLTSKNSMIQRKGRVGRCMDGLYIYCLETSATENLQFQFKNKPNEDMILPLVYNDTLYNFDLISNLRQLNNDLDQKIIDQTIEDLQYNNCIRLDKDNKLRSTYYGFKALKSPQTLMQQLQQYFQQFYNKNIGVLVTQIDSTNNKKIFIEELENNNKKQVPNYYLLLAAQLGYTKFIQAINLYFKQDYKTLQAKDKILSFLVSQFGIDVIPQNYNEKVLKAFITIYWRKRFPLPTSQPTLEEQKWCNMLGLNPSGLRSIELSYTQYWISNSDIQLPLIDQQLSRQYFLEQGCVLDETLQELEDLKYDQQFEVKHNQIWKQIMNQYSNGQKTSLESLCDYYQDIQKIQDIQSSVTLVYGITSNNYKLQLNYRSKNNNGSIENEYLQYLQYYSILTSKNMKLLQSKELQNKIKKITLGDDVYFQQSKYGLQAKGDSVEDQLAICLSLEQKANKNGQIKIDNTYINLPEESIFAELGQSKKGKFNISNFVAKNLYYFTQFQDNKQYSHGLTSNAIACYLLSLVLNTNYISLSFQFKNQIELMENLEQFSIYNNEEVIFSYKIQNTKNLTYLDKAMIKFLEILLLMNFTYCNIVKDDIAKNQLKIVEDCDDNYLPQLSKSKFLLNYSISSKFCEQCRKQLKEKYINNSLQGLIFITMQVFDQLDLTFNQLKLFQKDYYQEGRKDVQYQFNYNPLVYKELQSE